MTLLSSRGVVDAGPGLDCQLSLYIESCQVQFNASPSRENTNVRESQVAQGESEGPEDIKHNLESGVGTRAAPRVAEG